jgi:hypothetical protein
MFKMKSHSNLSKRAGYWASTILIAFVFLSGGALSLAGAEGPSQGMVELGYPLYFVMILGIAKVLGGIAILAPRFPRLKEWAYAGIVFDLLGASASHAAIGHPVGKVIAPLVVLGIAALSYALRPEASRPIEKFSELDVQSRPLSASSV